MTLIIKNPSGARLVMQRTWQPMDPDAAAYIAAVEQADGQALEEKVKIAIDNFVLGCKADGIWSAIKASCILAGARTLSGALVPLVGVAPTNFNFVSGDYNRKTGLIGDGSTKYLDTNRGNTADLQNNRHMSTFATAKSLAVVRSMMGTGPIAGRTRIFIQSTTDVITSCSDSTSTTFAGAYATGTGLYGISRSSSSSYNFISDRQVRNATVSSLAPASGINTVFAGGGTSLSSPRLAFYSIGGALDLALLDARVTALINAFAAAIP